MLQNYELPVLRGALALQSRAPQRALDALRVAYTYDLSTSRKYCLYPAYLRGLAHLELQQGQNAAHEFQKILDHPGLVGNSIVGALAHLQLGRAQVMMGDKVAARKSYNDFLLSLSASKDGAPPLQLEPSKASNKRCQGVTKSGTPCTAWAMEGGL